MVHTHEDFVSGGEGPTWSSGCDRRTWYNLHFRSAGLQPVLSNTTSRPTFDQLHVKCAKRCISMAQLLTPNPAVLLAQSQKWWSSRKSWLNLEVRRARALFLHAPVDWCRVVLHCAFSSPRLALTLVNLLAWTETRAIRR